MPLHPVFGDWLHWRLANTHFGYLKHGNGWRVLEWPTRHRYANGLTFYRWWRFFLAVQK